jgi:Tfp pilus assembly protein PilF
LATIYHETNKFDDAKNNYRIALSINPLDPDVYFNMGKCILKESGNSLKSEALPFLIKAYELYGPMFIEKKDRVQLLINKYC